MLVILSALFAILAFPPFGLWPFIVVAWVPLFIALRGAVARGAFYIGFGQGILLYGICLSWLWGLFGPNALVLWIILGIFVGVACALIVALRLSGLLGSVIGASIWVGCEFFRSEVYALHFPWITPGTGLPPTWLSPIVGVYGVSFLLVFGSLLVREKTKLRVIGISLLIGLMMSGFVSFSIVEGDIRVLAVQNEEGSFKDKMAQTTSAFDNHDVVLWPELGMGSTVSQTSRAKMKLLDFSRENKVIVVAGGYEDSGEELAYNAAMVFDGGVAVGMHFKNKPVPLFKDGKKGTEAKSIKTSSGLIGTPICFDCDHENVIRRMVEDGAEVILAPSLDAIHWSERQHDQHAELFRHRAAENNRWIAVAASSGRTQIIDNHGNRVATIPLIEPGVLEGAMSLKTGRTFYNRFGWVTGWICFAIATGAFLWVLVKSLIKRIQRKEET